MRREIVLSTIVGYLATYYPIFTEELSIIERTTGTVGLGICFLGLYTAISQIERKVHKHGNRRRISENSCRRNSSGN